jgi:hypothetical protein
MAFAIVEIVKDFASPGTPSINTMTASEHAHQNALEHFTLGHDDFIDL